MAVVGRGLPRTVDRVLAGAWLIRSLFLLVFVHIAKPGYLLPILPLGALVIGDFYARQRRGVALALIAVQALVNTAHFVLVTPPSAATRGGPVPYGDTTFLQPAASDLEPLTVPTVFTISQSDA